MKKKKLEFSDQVLALERISKDTKFQQDLGKNLIREVAQAVYEEKKGAEISNPDMELTFKKGDLVPADFRDRVETDAKGRALDDFSLQYRNLIIWLRIWIRFWARIIWPWLRMEPLNKFEDFTDRLDLSDEEIKLTGRLKKLY